MKIKVLGTGCARCQAVKRITAEVVKELGVDAGIEEVRDMKKIMEYPIITTPGLVINEELVCRGKVPSKAEVTQFIVNALNEEEKAASS